MKKFEPLPVKEEGNGSNLAHLTVDKGDIPMLVHALMIGVTTIRMCGGGKAALRMYHYQKVLEGLVSPGWKHIDREEDISNIVFAMHENEKWKITHKKRWKKDEEGSVEIRIGEQTWSVWRLKDNEFAELVDFLKSIAPITCELESAESEFDYNY